MRILRHNHIIHSFREMPKEKDISFGYVTVLVSDNPIEERNVLYSVEHGWNTTPNTPALGLSPEEMASIYVGWIERDGREIIPNHEDWLQRIDDLIEEIELKRREDPQKYETESEGNYWASLDELLDVLEQARDFAREVA